MPCQTVLSLATRITTCQPTFGHSPIDLIMFRTVSLRAVRHESLLVRCHTYTHSTVRYKAVTVWESSDTQRLEVI